MARIAAAAGAAEAAAAAALPAGAPDQETCIQTCMRRDKLQASHCRTMTAQVHAWVTVHLCTCASCIECLVELLPHERHYTVKSMQKEGVRAPAQAWAAEAQQAQVAAAAQQAAAAAAACCKRVLQRRAGSARSAPQRMSPVCHPHIHAPFIMAICR